MKQERRADADRDAVDRRDQGLLPPRQRVQEVGRSQIKAAGLTPHRENR